MTKKGIEKTEEVARGLRALEVEADVFLTSPYRRAVETAEIVAAALGFPKDKIRASDSLKPDGNPIELFRVLAGLRAASVICFGHAPNLDDVIARALNTRSHITALKKAGIACLELESVNPPKGMLVWLCVPKALRQLA